MVSEFVRLHALSMCCRSRMPFHMTVLGIYLGNEFSPLPRDHMELFGEAICEKVAEAAGTRSVQCWFVGESPDCGALFHLISGSFRMVKYQNSPRGWHFGFSTLQTSSDLVRCTRLLDVYCYENSHPLPRSRRLMALSVLLQRTRWC